MKQTTLTILTLLITSTCVHAEVVAGDWKGAELIADSVVQAGHWGTLFLSMLLLLMSKRILTKACPHVDPKLVSAPVTLFACGLLSFHAVRAASLDLWFAFHGFPIELWPDWAQHPFRLGQSPVGAICYLMIFLFLHPFVVQKLLRVNTVWACVPLAVAVFLPTVWLAVGFYAEAMMKMY